ncbi:ASCH domain-containing protein [Aurantimonas sp. HBX-1]|uniref:ASCH domain-containing protein n=1 Tax=Aurantimonas sp. HBX-1 TaxID=2906072 RepID=UPI001F40FB1D|nr:ASCH domain-containing protein [Aurantimonas sp. HBX-1]UIJ71289.1 ASCH domain-containing protein [Aurantimonas sp. HBX-1]
MLFRQHILERIASGEVTLAFRRWKRQPIRGGARLRTARGEVIFGSVQEVDEGSLTEDDAIKAGYGSLAELTDDLQSGEDRNLYRMEIVGLEEDGRIALREDDGLSAEEAGLLAKSFDRWDRANSAPNYHRRILDAIAATPEVSAAALARSLAVDKVKLKRDIRKLKEFGLTKSMSVGYRLSPRGEALLGMISEKGQ